MNFHRTKVMLTIFVLLLFPLTTCLTISVKANIPDDSQLLLNGTGSYSEDFTTVTYKSALTTASGWGTGIVTKERDFSWDILDFYPTVNPVFDIEVQGRKVYSAYYNASGGISTIGAYNLNNPQDIRFCSARGSWQQMLTIAVDGDVLYSGKHKDAIGAISTYNASNAYALGVGTVFLDYTEADGSITDIEPDGHIVYYTAYNSTSGRSFRVIDTTNPADQVNITNSWSSSQALGLAISGQLAYVAASTEGFYILNVSNKYAPVEIGYLDTPGNATEVIVDGGLAYLADGNAGIQIIDIRNPTNPSIIGMYNTPGNAQNLALQGRTLFVADGQAGVQVLDVADKTQPAFVTEISPLAYVYDIDLYGGILVVGAAEGIFTIRCAADWGITDFSQSYYENVFDAHNAYDVRVIGNIAYVVGGKDGFYTLDVSDPTNPILLDHFPTPIIGESFRYLDVKGQYAFVTDLFGLYTFDIQNPNDITQVNYLVGNMLQDVFAQGEILYMSWGGGGYTILNVSNPYSFSWSDELSQPHFGNNITALWAQGPHLYAVDNAEGAGDGLHIWDMMPSFSSPFLDGTDPRTSYFSDIIVDGDIAYASDRNWTVVINVTNPFLPHFETDIHDGTDYIRSTGVWNFGPYIMSASELDGVYLINATNLDFMTQTQTNYPNATGALKVTTHGDYTYVANTTNLIILRHFESAGDTYGYSSDVVSEPINDVTGKVTKATITSEAFSPAGCNIEYFMSVDGVNWEVVTPGVEYEFINEGSMLQWKVTMTSDRDRSTHLYTIEVNYKTPFLSGSMLWIVIGAGGGLLVIILIIVIAVSVSKRKKKVATR